MNEEKRSGEVNVLKREDRTDNEPKEDPEAKKPKIEDGSPEDAEMEFEDEFLDEPDLDPQQDPFAIVKKYEEGYAFSVLSKSDVIDRMNASIKEVNVYLDLSTTKARKLLMYFKWDKEKLIDQYFDGDQTKLLRDAGIADPIVVVKPPKEGDQECQICMDSIPAKEMVSLNCGHLFCIVCWNAHLTFQIKSGIAENTCPAHNCPVAVDDDTIETIVTDKGVIERYRQLLSKNFVDCNKLARWCISPYCNKAIIANDIKPKPVSCSCGDMFCFACGESWHGPVTCILLKTWKKKCADDSETSNWIAANTKECPKCHTSIEKNGGCNHMTCRSINCSYHFCWVCLGDWNSHQGNAYNCNRFNTDDTKMKENSKNALHRYLFYCNRYVNHLNSLKFERKLTDVVNGKMMELQENLNLSYCDVLFLSKAVHILCMCRQTLMVTYGFAFYLEKTPHAIIFEENQRDLEMATESLSEFLERDIQLCPLDKIREKVQGKANYCESRRRTLKAHVYEGYDHNYWKYTEKF